MMTLVSSQRYYLELAHYLLHKNLAICSCSLYQSTRQLLQANL